MTSISVPNQVEALPDDERIALKLRAKVIKDQVFDRAPELCVGRLDHELWEICLAAVLDDKETANTHDGTTLLDVQAMLDGLGDRFDVAAMHGNDANVELYRGLETNVRKMSNILGDMVCEEFVISHPAGSAPLVG